MVCFVCQMSNQWGKKKKTHTKNKKTRYKQIVKWIIGKWRVV